MFITQYSASEIELKLVISPRHVNLLCHFLIYGPAHETGVPPKGILPNSEPAVESMSVPPDVNGEFRVNGSHPKLSTEKFNPKSARTALGLRPLQGWAKEALWRPGREGWGPKEQPSPPFWWNTFARASGNLMQIQTSAQMQRIIAHYRGCIFLWLWCRLCPPVGFCICYSFISPKALKL